MLVKNRKNNLKKRYVMEMSSLDDDVMSSSIDWDELAPYYGHPYSNFSAFNLFPSIVDSETTVVDLDLQRCAARIYFRGWSIHG